MIFLITLILSRSNQGNPIILLIMVKTYPPREQHGHHTLLDLPGLGEFPFEGGDFSVHVFTVICLIYSIALILSRQSNHGNPIILLIMVKTDFPRQQLGHHALLDLPGFGELFFQRGDFGIHVAQDFGDGGVFSEVCRTHC